MGCLERDAVRSSPCPSGESCEVTSHGFCLLFWGSYVNQDSIL